MALLSPSSGPLAQSPLFARDNYELRSVVGTQTAEVDSLKDKLAHAQRECARLRHRLRDAEGDLIVAVEATSSATEKLGTHAIRNGLVLTAGLERCGVERSALDDECQRMERLLCERDREIAKLRRAARDLESSQLQGDLDLRGLVAQHETASSVAQAMSADVTELLHHVGGVSRQGSTSTPAWPSQREIVQTQAITGDLAAKHDEHHSLRCRAEALSADARRLEVEETELGQVVTRFEQGLRTRQQQMKTHDKQFVRDDNLLREHCEELRHVLQQEKRNSVGLDQRAVLQPQSGPEAEGVRREVNAIIHMLPNLVAQLRDRGRYVCSAAVIGDAVDEGIHAYLKDCAARKDNVPSLVCRLGSGDYFLGSERVLISISREGQLVVHGSNAGQTVLLHEFVSRHGRQIPAPRQDRSPTLGTRRGSPPRSF